MKRIIGITICTLALTACGGGNKKQAMIDACVKDGGNSRANCTCIANTAEDMLDSAVFAKLAEATANGQGMRDLMNQLTPAQEPQFMSFTQAVGGKCSGTR
ncbi:MAG: hypothetical protein AAGF57_20870 [Pseudomonadota bacterium]